VQVTQPGGASLDECAVLADACGPATGPRDAVSGLADQELIGKLKYRHRVSEGSPDEEGLSESGARPEAAGAQTARDGVAGAGLLPRADSEHFSLDACESPGRSEDHAARAAETFCSEWQFDIMNSLPRNKALELVEHLRLMVREKEQAGAEARRLRLAYAELEQRLAGSERRGAKDWRTSACFWLCSLCVLGLALFAGLLVSMGVLLLPAAVDCAPCSPAPPPRDNLSELETVPTDSDAEAMRRENEELREVLEKLQLDVSQAERNNQSVVCWNL